MFAIIFFITLALTVQASNGRPINCLKIDNDLDRDTVDSLCKRNAFPQTPDIAIHHIRFCKPDNAAIDLCKIKDYLPSQSVKFDKATRSFRYKLRPKISKERKSAKGGKGGKGGSGGACGKGGKGGKGGRGGKRGQDGKKGKDEKCRRKRNCSNEKKCQKKNKECGKEISCSKKERCRKEKDCDTEEQCNINEDCSNEGRCEDVDEYDTSEERVAVEWEGNKIKAGKNSVIKISIGGKGGKGGDSKGNGGKGGKGK